MSSAAAVNSLAYWDGRFDGEWEAVHGRAQSRFFGELARALWPAWLAERMRAGSMSLCDWGCALGDGTAELSSLAAVPVTGVDFSAVAVQQAQKLYPQCRFMAADWLAEGSTAEPFDVVFSSNTLEHFDAPWTVFASLAHRARAYIVLLLPYQEPAEALNPEHRYRFDRATIPLCPQPGWVLCDAATTDLGPSPFWAGKQVLLVYGRDEVLVAQGFADAHSRQSRLEAAGAAQLATEQADALAEALRQRDLASHKLAEVVALQLAQARQLHEVLASRSWRLTAPLARLFSWGRRR